LDKIWRASFPERKIMKKLKITIAVCLVATIASAAEISTTTGLDKNTPWITVLDQIDHNTTVAAAVAARMAVSGVVLGSNVSTFLGTPTSANLAAAVTNETGTSLLVFNTSPTLVTPILGTPTSGTLTNCTGLPVAGITASTSTALGVGSIELGHATDTTIARVSAGKISVEGVNVVTTSSTDTLTNKTLTTPVIGTGLTASGSTANDFSGSTGTFLTSTGATTVSGAFIGKTDTRSGPGAVSVTTMVTKLTTTGVADALTLANGTDGQIKIIVHDVDGGSAALVPTTKTGFTTITFTNVGESCTLIYVTTRGWMILALNGAVAT
jgi:hypothetical protein